MSTVPKFVQEARKKAGLSPTPSPGEKAGGGKGSGGGAAVSQQQSTKEKALALTQEAYKKFGKIDQRALQWIEQQEKARGISPEQTREQVRLYKQPSGIGLAYYSGTPPKGYTEVSQQEQLAMQRRGEVMYETVRQQQEAQFQGEMQRRREERAAFMRLERKPQHYPLAQDDKTSFERKVGGIKEFEARMLGDKRLGNIEKTASLITFGGGRPVEERSFAGQVAQKTTSSLIGWPFYMLHGVPVAASKAFLTIEGLSRKETRKSTLEAMKDAGKDVLSLYDPRTSTGASTLLSASIFALPMAASMYQTGKSPFLKTRYDVKSTTYSQPVIRSEKVATTSKKIEISSSGRKITYGRTRVLEGTTGKSSPVSISEGTITRGGLKISLKGVQVGKDSYGVFHNKGLDVYFSSLDKGKQSINYVSPEGELLSSSVISSKPGTMKISRSSVQTKFVQREPQHSKIMKVDNEIFRTERTIWKVGEYRIRGKETSFKGLRKVDKAVYGEAITLLQQTDKASPFLKRATVGKTTTVEMLPSDIQYAKQPTYKPNIKTYSSNLEFTGSRWVEIPETVFIREPKLVTVRVTGTKVQQRFAYTQSGLSARAAVDPFLKMLESMGKKGQFQFQTNVRQIQAKAPALQPAKPSLNMILSGETAISLLPSVFSMPAVSPQFPVSEEITISTPALKKAPKTSVAARSIIRTANAPSVSITHAARSIAETRAETRSRARSIAETRAETRSRTLTRSVTRTLSRTRSIAETRAGGVFWTSASEPKIPKIYPPAMGFLPEKRRTRRPMFHMMSAGRASYTPTLWGQLFLRPIKAEKSLSKQIYEGALSIRAPVVFPAMGEGGKKGRLRRMFPAMPRRPKRRKR